MTGTIWEQVLGRIETKVNNHTYLTWFENTSLLRDSGSNILVQVVDPMAVDWMNKHYSGLIAEALSEVGRPGVSFSFLPEGGEMPALPAPASMPRSSDAEELEAGFDPADQAEPTGVSGLSPRYSFDTFIVGASNQFAHAACRAVAEAPSRSYNPLFLYGGVGLGKTHLMHAIGHYVLTHSPGLKLTYISAERFMNEVINAIRYDRSEERRVGKECRSFFFSSRRRHTR